MYLLFFVILFQQIILLFIKDKSKLPNIHFSMKHLCHKIITISIEDFFLYFFTNTNIPSFNNSPIIIMISIILTYMLRRIVRTYSLYQSIVHLYYPEDKRIYWLGSYYLGVYFNLVEFLIKIFICISIIEINYWNCFLYLLSHNLIEISLYYTNTIDTSNELFHIISNYIFKKLNE